ncbi:MAG: nucleotide disphospho-sugar-binding domain-containing protein [Nostoc sp.]
MFITYGGTNSVWEGLINKVPLIIFPQGGDQYLVAHRLEQLGAGVWVRQKNIELNKLRSLTENIIQNAQIRNNVELLGNSLIAAGGTKKAVDKILDFKYRSSGLYV